jgi:hypothetical protein
VDGWANKLEKVLPDMFPSFLLKQTQSHRHDSIENFRDFSEIIVTLCKHDDFTDFEMHCL